jgi:integrase
MNTSLTISKPHFLSETPPVPVATVHDPLEQIHSFADIERLLLRGRGHTPGTYATYRARVKLFYEWSGGKHPAQVTAGDLEAYYEHRTALVGRNTAHLDVFSMKALLGGLRAYFPRYRSPFDGMTKKLWKKLSRTKQNGTKKALNRLEVRKIIDFLALNTSIKGREDYAIFRMLYATGLRGSELCAITWGDLELDEEEQTYYLAGIGKGGKPFRQEVVDPEAVPTAKAYFLAAFDREPRAKDHVFWTQPSYHGEQVRPLPYHALYDRVVGIGARVKAAGIVTRNITFSPHLLRRSIITNLSKAGMRVKALQKFSRHSNANTLLAFYVDDDEPAKKYFQI